ncbi:MAG: hypothetical protein NT032_01440 [Actinobacteria bacterium]|nr:hypothetical protein [Actinomycetota bacterium]
MNIEDFEHKLRSHDPAANLEGRDTAEHRALFEQAINGQPTNVISISRWTNRRKAVSAAAAALLVIGFGGPVISGATSASPTRLVFGESQSNMTSDKSELGGASREGSLSAKDSYMGYWGFYNYVLNADVNIDIATSAPAYKIVNISNIDKRVQEIADALGIKNLVKSDSEDVTSTTSDPQDASENFYAWTNEGSASFSYYNSKVDPWRDCYSVDSTKDSEPVSCNPIANNLYTESEAKAAAKQLLAELGFETGNMKFDSYKYDYSTDVYATVQVNGIDSPLSYYISYTANGDLYSASGSLTKMVEIGSYDLIDVASAIERANTLTNRTIDTWKTMPNEDSTDVEPGNSGSTADDGDVSEPSEPRVDTSQPSDDPTAAIDEPVEPLTYQPTTVNVSRVELGYQMFWMNDNSVLWLPVVNFFGTTKDFAEETQYGSTVAVVDSQIDIDSLYMSMGMIGPMSRSAMID